MPYMVIFFILFISLDRLHASTAKNYVHLSPDAKVHMANENMVRLITRRNTFIDLIIDKHGKLEAAEGVNLNRGDMFTPGQGLLNLNQIERRMISMGERIYGKWRLIKYQEYGWIYQVNVVSHQGQSLFHLINAHSGELIGTMARLAPLNTERQVAKD